VTGLSGTGIEEVAELARTSAEPYEMTPGKVYAIHTGNGDLRVVDLLWGDENEWAVAPRRREGTVSVDDVDSFVWLWQRWADPAQADVYADRVEGTVTAVLNSHPKDEFDVAGWRDHRVVLKLRITESWNDWCRMSGQFIGQADMAEFLEDHLADVREPAAASLLDIAQRLQGSMKVEWRSAQVLADGTRQLGYVETADAAAAGATGNMRIPTEVKLGLQVFRGVGDAYEVTGRFRYRINGGRLTLAIKLLQVQETRDAALAAVVGDVAEKIGQPVLWGRG
jgi:uncharacterized protein YfdQ (DUF2303 family)